MKVDIVIRPHCTQLTAEIRFMEGNLIQNRSSRHSTSSIKYLSFRSMSKYLLLVSPLSTNRVSEQTGQLRLFAQVLTYRNLSDQSDLLYLQNYDQSSSSAAFKHQVQRPPP